MMNGSQNQEKARGAIELVIRKRSSTVSYSRTKCPKDINIPALRTILSHRHKIRHERTDADGAGGLRLHVRRVYDAFDTAMNLRFAWQWVLQ
jgi:hypothetical protein